MTPRAGSSSEDRAALWLCGDRTLCISRSATERPWTQTRTLVLRFSRHPRFDLSMSELQLSAQLVGELQQVVQTHDASASDPGVAAQYLCAVVGFLLGQQDMPRPQKDEVLEQLGAFMKHVADDVDRQKHQQPPPPPAHVQQEAFGIWKPPTK